MPITHQAPPAIKVELSTNEPLLTVEDLFFTYPTGRTALHGISFKQSSGEKVALVGHNGSGKSTLLLNLIGILNGEGNIRVAGLELTEENLPIIRSKVGLVFQNPDDQLFSPTVFADVAFGPIHLGYSEEETIKRVESALSAVGMSDYSNRLSYHLSAGEKKRISIATVLSMDPDIIVLDEPTAGLDPKARRSLINLLRDLPQGMLVATHDLLMVKELFPRTIILHQGTIAADGPTQTILGDTALLETHGLEMPL
jgi:cobalt/nickel transport system ATP-binding protein